MAANLRLVVHAAQRDALELAAQRARNRPAQAGFAHARRSDKAKDRPLHVRLQLEHAQVVENAVLHLLQLVVILVENLPGLADIDLRARALGPGQHRQPLDVVAGERVVGGHGRHARQPRQLLQRLLLHVFGHAGGFDLLAQLLDVALALVLLAQLLLDGLHLLAQVVVALRLLHLVLHLGLDLGAQLLHLDLLGQQLVQLLQPVRPRSASPAAAACRPWSGRAATRRQNPPGARALRCSPRWSAARRRAWATRRRSAGTGRSHCAPAPRTPERSPASTSSSVSTSAIMNGSVWMKRTSRTRLTPSVKTKRLWLGMRTTLCTVARVPTCVQVGRAWARPGADRAARRRQSSAPRPAIQSAGWSFRGQLSRAAPHGETEPYPEPAEPESCAFPDVLFGVASFEW